MDTQRHRTLTCRVGAVLVGGGHPIVVQSMTNTDTEDAAATAKQVVELARAGSELVRITVNTKKAASQVEEIARRVRGEGVAAPKDAESVVAEAMVASALRSAEAAVKIGLPADHVILSVKASRLPQMVAAYEDLARRCEHPLHLGLTEAGMGSKGIVATTAALAVLLQQGIGDTIRISLTPEPNGDRTREVIVAQ